MVYMQRSNDFQNLFVNRITKGIKSPILAENIIPVGKLDIPEVLNVYQSDYKARLSEALGENLEATWTVLGDEEFFKISEQYLLKYPSDSEDLGSISGNFQQFLQGHEINQDYPFLQDLVDFESQFWDLFHKSKIQEVKDFDFPNPEVLPSAIFTFIENFKIFSWDYKIYDIWQLKEEGFENESVEKFLIQQSIILYKHNHLIKGLVITKPQWLFLNELTKKYRLEEVLDRIEISPTEIQQLFSLLKENSLIKEIKTTS